MQSEGLCFGEKAFDSSATSGAGKAERDISPQYSGSQERKNSTKYRGALAAEEPKSRPSTRSEPRQREWLLARRQFSRSPSAGPASERWRRHPRRVVSPFPESRPFDSPCRLLRLGEVWRLCRFSCKSEGQSARCNFARSVRRSRKVVWEAIASAASGNCVHDHATTYPHPWSAARRVHRAVLVLFGHARHIPGNEYCRAGRSSW